MNTVDEIAPKEREEREELYKKVNAVRKKHSLIPIPFSEDPEVIYCSFCGKEPKEIQSMIEGAGVFICDECIEFSLSLIQDN